MRPPRVAEMIANDLRRRIITGELTETLPREAELVEMFGVSRPSMREAIRILETEGLLHIRRGKLGGAVIHRPTAESAAFHLGLVLQADAVTIEDLAEARLAIEPVCARVLASSDEHEQAAAELRALVDESEQLIATDSPDFTAVAGKFHKALVELCGNSTIRLLAGSLEAVWNSQELEWAEQAVARGEYPHAKLQRLAVSAHRTVVAKIAAGDADGAERALRRHLLSSQAHTTEPGRTVDVLGH
jgi:GntR family transcriptional regulator, transcriptional repressor for pyruvate dehydrogenase complex